MVAKLTDIAVMLRRQRVHELREKGLQLQDIADKVDLSKRGVLRYLKLPKPNIMKLSPVYGWQDEAACAGLPQEWFFADSHARGLRGRADRQKAFAVCARCPVARQCHDTAVANLEQHGVWGGRDFSRAHYEHDPVSGVVTAIGGWDAQVAEVS